MFRFAAPIAALLLGACATTPPHGQTIAMPAAPEGTDGWQEIGERGEFGPVIVPLRVIEDSRCPMNARCVWAGRLVVETEILLRGGAESLIVPMTMEEPVPVADGAATLVAVWPDQVTGHTIAAGEYRFAYRFDGGL